MCFLHLGTARRPKAEAAQEPCSTSNLQILVLRCAHLQVERTAETLLKSKWGSCSTTSASRSEGSPAHIVTSDRHLIPYLATWQALNEPSLLLFLDQFEATLIASGLGCMFCEPFRSQAREGFSGHFYQRFE